MVICARHHATPFAYTDTMWAKYGPTFAERVRFEDPKTKRLPTVNVYQSAEHGMSLPNRGTTLDAVVKRGVHFAVCQLATRAYATAIAEQSGRKADDIYQELASNLVGNAHMVAAGISRSTERRNAAAHSRTSGEIDSEG